MQEVHLLLAWIGGRVLADGTICSVEPAACDGTYTGTQLYVIAIQH